MNVRFKYLPLTLLLSIAAYGMHDSNSGVVTLIEDEYNAIETADMLHKAATLTEPDPQLPEIRVVEQKESTKVEKSLRQH